MLNCFRFRTVLQFYLCAPFFTVLVFINVFFFVFLQTSNEHAFDLWVKTIAIELIRQTPLDAVKYLDILTLAECWNRKSDKKPVNNSIPCNICSQDPLEESQKQIYVDINRNHVKLPPVLKVEENAENTVQLLLKKCQNVEHYVPVREKLVLFESLCKLGRVRSSEDVSIRVSLTNNNNNNNKRARSLHDLSNCLVSTGVREICKYFEKKTDKDGANISKKNKRLIYSDTNLNMKSNFRTNNSEISCT